MGVRPCRRAQKKNQLQVEDVPAFVNAVKLMKGRGFDIFEISKKFSNYVDLVNTSLILAERTENARANHEQLERENASLEELRRINSQKLHELEILSDMGFGLAEFKQLHYLIDEVAVELGDPLKKNAAVKKFFEDMVNYYQEYVRLKKSVAELKSESSKFIQERNNLAFSLTLIPIIGDAMVALVLRGVSKTDLMNIRSYLIEYRSTEDIQSAEDRKYDKQNTLPEKPKNKRDVTVQDSNSHQTEDVHQFSEYYPIKILNRQLKFDQSAILTKNVVDKTSTAREDLSCQAINTDLLPIDEHAAGEVTDESGKISWLREEFISRDSCKNTRHRVWHYLDRLISSSLKTDLQISDFLSLQLSEANDLQSRILSALIARSKVNKLSTTEFLSFQKFLLLQELQAEFMKTDQRL